MMTRWQVLVTLVTLLHFHIVMATNKSNCSNSFSILEESLLSLESNRFNLLKTFYPPRGALPVFLTVTYTFDDSENQFGNRGNKSVWYWSESEIYFIQPLEVLQFTSLFHSNFYYRTNELDLVLNEDCYGTGTEFMEILTQRVSGI